MTPSQDSAVISRRQLLVGAAASAAVAAVPGVSVARELVRLPSPWLEPNLLRPIVVRWTRSVSEIGDWGDWGDHSDASLMRWHDDGGSVLEAA